jgi:hypothetical protein
VAFFLFPILRREVYHANGVKFKRGATLTESYTKVWLFLLKLSPLGQEVNPEHFDKLNTG